MPQKRLIIVLASALVVAVAVAVIFLSPLGAAITGAGGQAAQTGAAATQDGNSGAVAPQAGGQSLDSATASEALAQNDSGVDAGTGGDAGAAANGSTAGGAGAGSGAGSSGSGSGSAGGSANSNSANAGSGNAGSDSPGGGSGQQQPAALTCYVQIDCLEVLGNNDLNPSKKSIVPASGWILGKTAVQLQAGQTAFDALQAATQAAGIQMDSTGPANAAYVRGIANLYERDCGQLSGWKFSINGSFPNTGSGSIKLNPGDTVSWTFKLTV
jgi:hypothetical protein